MFSSTRVTTCFLSRAQDFGLSKDTTMSNPKTYCGTISYMAPEVTDLVRGKAVCYHRTAPII